MIKNILTVFVILGTLVGCASVPMGSPDEDMKLKMFEKPSDTAGVYIYRNESMGGGVKMDVELDGRAIGQTAAKTYLYKEVSAGQHTVTSKAENDNTLTFEAIAGKLHYIWQEVKMGLLYARSELKLVSEEEGQEGVKESKLAITK